MRRRLVIAAVTVATPAIVLAGWLAAGAWDLARDHASRREVDQ